VLTDRDWQLLLRRISQGKCTPFLGAGACYGTLPMAADIASQWSSKYEYPMESHPDLARVAQYLAVQFDPMFPKEELVREFIDGIPHPDFDEAGETHGVLASLPLSLYMTTNYDDFMYDALVHHDRFPRRAVCRWNSVLQEQACVLDDAPPTEASPVVYHFHGWRGQPESLILTEDDYLNFLVSVSRNADLLHASVKEALSARSLLFIGYGLRDWSFRVLFQGLITMMESSLRRISVTVQLLPISSSASPAQKARVEEYLTQYLDRMDMRVHWGTATEFVQELGERWREFGENA